KYYGLIWMTKRGYLLTTFFAAMFVLALGLIVGLLGLLPPLPGSGQPPPPGLAPGFTTWFYNNFWWVILALLVLEAIDILTVLHKFRRKEAEQQARLGEAQPNP